MHSKTISGQEACHGRSPAWEVVHPPPGRCHFCVMSTPEAGGGQTLVGEFFSLKGPWGRICTCGTWHNMMAGPALIINGFGYIPEGGFGHVVLGTTWWRAWHWLSMVLVILCNVDTSKYIGWLVIGQWAARMKNLVCCANTHILTRERYSVIICE